MTELERRAAHAVLWSALEIAARYGVQLAVMIVLARLLTPVEFGLIAMLLVFTSLSTLLIDAGFGTALVQRQRTTADDETTVFVFTTVMSLIVAIILWFAAPAIAEFYTQPPLIPLTHLLLLALPLGALGAVPDALLTMRLDFRARTRAEIIASLCSGVLAVVLAWRGFGVWSLAWQILIGIGVRAVLLWRYSGWRPRGRFRAESFRGLFAFGGYMLMSNLLNTLSTRLQSLLIGKLFDSRALGYYTMAQNTQQVPASFISGILTRVGLPVFSTVAEQPEKLLGALRLSLRIAIFLFLPCMIGIAVIAEPLVVLLYGARWAPAAPLLSVLALSAAFWPLHVLNLAAIGARGRADLIFRLEIGKRIVSIGLILVCSPYGPMAIAWAVLASSLFAVLINTWYSKKLLDYGLLTQLADQLSTLLLSLLAGLMGCMVLHFMRHGTVAMIVAVAASASTYVAGALLAKHLAFDDLCSLLRTLQAGRMSSPRSSIEP